MSPCDSLVESLTGITVVAGSFPNWNSENLFSYSFTHCQATTITSLQHNFNNYINIIKLITLVKRLRVMNFNTVIIAHCSFNNIDDNNNNY